MTAAKRDGDSKAIAVHYTCQCVAEYALFAERTVSENVEFFDWQSRTHCCVRRLILPTNQHLTGLSSLQIARFGLRLGG